MFKRVSAVRGAVIPADDSPSIIENSVHRLVEEIITCNRIKYRDIISIHFTQTADLTSKNPAAALRLKGFSDIPLFCSQEPRYSGELKQVIRVLITYYRLLGRKPKPVYLGEAKKLRRDLTVDIPYD